MWLRHFDLGPQAIPEALRAAFGDLGSTFGSYTTMSGLQKIENMKNRKIFVQKDVKQKSHFKENLYFWIVSGCKTPPPDLFAVKNYNLWPEGKFLRWPGDEF